MSKALREVGIASPAALLATYVTDRAGLDRYAHDAPATTDYRPRIEYPAWVRDGEFSRVLPRVLAAGTTAPPDANAGAPLTAEISAEGRRLMEFYQASLDVYVGNRKGWAEAMGKVLAEDRSNPYYSWFTAGIPEDATGGGQ
jgi:spermidine synthase